MKSYTGFPVPWWAQRLFIVVAAVFCIQAAHADESVSLGGLCKAAVGKVMGRDPLVMIEDASTGGVVFIHYFRAADNNRWDYKCRVEGPRIVWATKDGRWRNDSADEVITYRVVKDGVEITEAQPSGLRSTEKYKNSQLGTNRK